MDKWKRSHQSMIFHLFLWTSEREAISRWYFTSFYGQVINRHFAPFYGQVNEKPSIDDISPLSMDKCKRNHQSMIFRLFLWRSERQASNRWYFASFYGQVKQKPSIDYISPISMDKWKKAISQWYFTSFYGLICSDNPGLEIQQGDSSCWQRQTILIIFYLSLWT